MHSIKMDNTGSGSDPGFTNINVNAFAAKFKGKREIYNFLTLDVKAYLPPYETITVVGIDSIF
jgi:hypothetical protein